MTGLLTAMHDLYDYVIAAGRLPKLDDKRKKLLKDMSLQTAECAYFIREKAQVESFGMLSNCKALSVQNS